MVAMNRRKRRKKTKQEQRFRQGGWKGRGDYAEVLASQGQRWSSDFFFSTLYSPCLFISLTCALLQSLPTSAHRGAKQINWKIWISFHLAWPTLRLFSSSPHPTSSRSQSLDLFSHRPSPPPPGSITAQNETKKIQKYCHGIVYSDAYRCRFWGLPWASRWEWRVMFIIYSGDKNRAGSRNYRPVCEMRTRWAK